MDIRLAEVDHESRSHVFRSRSRTATGRRPCALPPLTDLPSTRANAALFEATFDELCDLAGVDPEARARFALGEGRTLFSNGWQSWCFAGELAAGERIPRARIVPNIAVYCDGPGRPEARDEILSRFVTYVRAGNGRIVLASRGSPDRATPSVSFRWNRATLALGAEIAAEGAFFATGELVAEIRLFYREGYFAVKDALRDAFRGYGHFDRLTFLGPTPGGYESWYNHYTRIDDRIISGDLASIGANDNLINAYYLRRGKPTVFQIDDGWERAVGEWEADPVKFPRGMRAFAEEIEAKGMMPGIWIAPLIVTKGSAIFRERPEWLLRDERGKAVPAGFNPGWDGVFYCLDISLREVEDYLSGLFDTIVEEWGYRYLKLDFLYAGFLGGARAKGGAAYEHYDRLMRRLTARVEDSRGRGVAYLGCGAPLEPSFRHFPLMRIGADTKGKWEDGLLKYVLRHQGRPAAYTNLTHSIGRSPPRRLYLRERSRCGLLQDEEHGPRREGEGTGGPGRLHARFADYVLRRSGGIRGSRGGGVHGSRRGALRRFGGKGIRRREDRSRRLFDLQPGRLPCRGSSTSRIGPGPRRALIPRRPSYCTPRASGASSPSSRGPSPYSKASLGGDHGAKGLRTRAQESRILIRSCRRRLTRSSSGRSA